MSKTYRIGWSMRGAIDFESDETDPLLVMKDFMGALDERCIDVLGTKHGGEVDDFKVDEVDGVHHHEWAPSYFEDEVWCLACATRRKVPS